MFLREAPDAGTYSRWIHTLSDARGRLTLGYLGFLAGRVGGVRALSSHLPSQSRWKKVVDAFEDDFAITPSVQTRLWQMLETRSNDEFFMALQLLEQSSAIEDPSFFKHVTASIIERVFSHVRIDVTGRVVFSLSSHGQAKFMADDLDIRYTRGEDLLWVRLDRLSVRKLKVSSLLMAGESLEVPATPWPRELEISRLELLSLMRPETQETFRKFLTLNDDFSGFLMTA